MSTKKAIVDEVELGDLEGEEETPIKWRNYEIETLIAIRGEMEEEFAKSTRKQGMHFIYVLSSLIFYMIKSKYKSSDTDWAFLKALAFAACLGPPAPLSPH